jgi:quercetin dioxygenase-like cupin family protein
MSFTSVTPAEQQSLAERVQVLYAHPIGSVPTQKLVTLLVTYPPLAKDPPHRHGLAFASAYVMRGTLWSSLNDEPLVEYEQGKSWTEQPGDLHGACEIRSDQIQAVLLATLVCPVDQTEFVV